SPHLVAYWRGPTLIACNYATGRKVDLPLKAWEVLNACGEWTPTAALAMAGFVPPKTFPALIDRMVALELLERSDRPRDPRAVAMDALAPWNPQVGFFHTTTRDVHFTPRAFNRRHMRAKAAKIPPPRPVKRYPSVKATDLPGHSPTNSQRFCKRGGRGAGTHRYP